ncbi:conserved hypothetical protein [delta proteobacterium NaphS2]|nr:conserved hypothetical protein [delta proteobacterium NaphS2]
MENKNCLTSEINSDSGRYEDGCSLSVLAEKFEKVHIFQG